MRLVLSIFTFLLFIATGSFYLKFGSTANAGWIVTIVIVSILLAFAWRHGLSMGMNPPALPFAPSPLADRGHNVYAVANEDVRNLVQVAFIKAGYALQGTFSVGPTNQRLFGSDLVLMLLDGAPEKDPNYDPEVLPFIARSLVVPSPQIDALHFVHLLRQEGFATKVHEPLPDHFEKFYMITSDAFLGGWGLAFRVSGPKMGKPDTWSVGR
ncbi:hypothetical protein COB87_002565 [Candidatus Wolfebacteria bacterium]|nr:hypothetical protein [Candidatus Wolfebacteria bacterium]